MQVRFAACVAARAFMLAAGDGARGVLPGAAAAAVLQPPRRRRGRARLLAETWRLVLGTEGPAWVARCLPQARPLEVLYTLIFVQRRDLLLGRWAPRCRAWVAALPAAGRARAPEALHGHGDPSAWCWATVAPPGVAAPPAAGAPVARELPGRATSPARSSAVP